MDEEQLRLVSAAKHGDKDAFASLVRAYKDYVFRIAYGIVMNRAEAEDVAQEVFVKAYVQLRNLRDSRSFPSWIATIAARRALDAAKQKQRWPLIPMDENILSTQTDDIAHADRRMVIHQLLSQLNPIHRAVLVLREIYGYDYDEMAKMLGIPIGTVRSRLNIARTQLRKLVMDSGEVEKSGNETPL